VRACRDLPGTSVSACSSPSVRRRASSARARQCLRLLVVPRRSRSIPGRAWCEGCPGVPRPRAVGPSSASRAVSLGLAVLPLLAVGVGEAREGPERVGVIRAQHTPPRLDHLVVEILGLLQAAPIEVGLRQAIGGLQRLRRPPRGSPARSRRPAPGSPATGRRGPGCRRPFPIVASRRERTSGCAVSWRRCCAPLRRGISRAVIVPPRPLLRIGHLEQIDQEPRDGPGRPPPRGSPPAPRLGRCGRRAGRSGRTPA
jgi:hypothetical protein